MNLSSHKTRDEFDGPATYRIRVIGWVGDDWVKDLSGMRVADMAPEGDGLVTTLEGEVRDQSALVGMLNALYGLHLPMISIERLSSRPVDF